MTFRNILIAAAALGALGLSACAVPSTSTIGSSATPNGTENPPGQNSFVIVFDPNNPGVPQHVIAQQGKDEDEMSFSTSYTFPDGRGVTWEYGVMKSAGSQQTAAIADALISIAQAEAETVQAITPEVVQAIVEGLRIVSAPTP